MRAARPAAAPPAAAMWLACSIGMTLGLALDCRSTTLSVLASLCTAGSGGAAALARHFALLPATNLGMLLGGFIGLALMESGSRGIVAHQQADSMAARMGVGVACNLAMLGAMWIACCLGSALATRLGIGWNGLAMLVAMETGMICGSAAIAIAMRYSLGATGKAWRPA